MLKKRPVAKVDENEIYFWQYNDAMDSFAREVLKKSLDQLTPSELERCKEEAIHKLIAAELFYLDAVEAGLTATDDEVSKALQEFIKIVTLEGYASFLAERELTEEEFKEYIKKQLIRERYLSALLKRVTEPTTEEIENFYQKVKDKITLPPRFSFIVAYLETTDKSEKERFKSLFLNVANKKIALNVAEKILEDTRSLFPNLNVVNYDKKSVEEMNGQVKSLLLSIDDECFSSIFDAPDEISIFYMKKKELNIPMTEEESRKEVEKFYRIDRLKRILDAYVEVLKEKRKVEVRL